ncbi:MAG: hypothetical protein M0D55_13070 [Elusimicrobiota bacterium]|nr:MAG: hypothetical protein M0D55_13070 [Elusimicrobiota bacterium]
MRILLFLALYAHAAPKPKELSEDITVKARAAGAAGVQVAPPTASKPVIDEVLRSLSLGRGRLAPAAERIRVGGDVARYLRPYPEAPFLALSPANIVALYDEWSFEVLDNEGEIVMKSDGVGMLNEKIDWDGAGPDGRLAVVAGRSYRYRFTGRRAGRAFVVESDPVPLRSFTWREYAGRRDSRPNHPCSSRTARPSRPRAPTSGSTRSRAACAPESRAPTATTSSSSPRRTCARRSPRTARACSRASWPRRSSCPRNGSWSP